MLIVIYIMFYFCRTLLPNDMYFLVLFSRKLVVLMNYQAYKALYFDLNRIMLKDWDPRFKTDLDFFLRGPEVIPVIYFVLESLRLMLTNFGQELYKIHSKNIDVLFCQRYYLITMSKCHLPSRKHNKEKSPRI